MAVVEMSRLNLIAMSYDRDKILNALNRTQATEIKLHSETDNTVPLEADTEALNAALLKGETALEVLLSRVETRYKDEKRFKEEKNSPETLGEVEISYSEFMSAKDNIPAAEQLIDHINALLDNERELNVELGKINRLIATASIYSTLESPLKLPRTAHVGFKLGVIPAAQKDAFLSAAEGYSLIGCKVLGTDAESALIALAVHKAAEADSQELLQSFEYAACPFDDDCTGAELYNSLVEKRDGITLKLKENDDELMSLDTRIRELKIYCDYIGFELEKAQTNEKLRATNATFLLEAYAPKEAQDCIKAAIDEVSSNVWYEFSVPSDDETPPTLLKNNKIVKNFESITNTYSPVNYREFDPNTVMAVFYSLFLGFIMGDIGYGLLMLLGGCFVYFRSKRETGMKMLAGVFAAGGVFAIIWGVLFNSFLGIQFPFLDPHYDPAVLNEYGKPVIGGIMPDAMNGRYSLMGIQVPAVLVIAMLVGALQLLAGYVCKAVQCWRRGEIFDGICDGMSWAVFMLGVELAVIGLVEEFNISILAVVGGITAGAGLLFAVVTAGRKEKFFGKFTKGFGAAYGVINVVSDILSYARLYGLMLSGAVIAQIISGFVITGYNGSEPFITSGNPLLIILGIFLIVVGHVFNLAIGLLGAYIHDARLQYVEFYGRFFEGEGEIFTPLGSKQRYIYINR